MGTIRERRTSDGEVRYQAFVRLRGHPREIATFRRRRDAERWIAHTEHEIREHRHFGTSEARRRTLAELVDRYLQDALPLLAESDRRGRTRQLNWWVDRLGTLKVADVTPALIVEARDELARSVAPATVNRHLSALSRVFSLGRREWGWAETNPVSAVSRRQEPRGRERFLSEAEAETLLVACAANRELRAYVLLALTTAARLGELEKLRWKDVDLERGVVQFRDTKNRESRSVPLSARAAEVLAELGRVRRFDGQVLDRFPRLAWERARAAAGLDGFRFHDLRHTAASWLAMSGATTAELASILGHRTLLMVKRYAHFSQEHHRPVLERMAERLPGGRGGDPAKR